jgi:hypothetical protein
LTESEHRVRAFVGVFEHHIAGIVDKIGVVAGTSQHGVGAARAIEQIVAGIAVGRVYLVVAADAEAADGGIVGGGYALIASRSRRTPIMFITRVML